MIFVYALLTPVCMRALEIGVSVTFNNSVNINDKVKVTYKNNGEDSVSVIDYNTKAEDKTVPDRDGFRFDGWFLGEDKFDFETKITQDIELVAKYTKMVYNISYNMNGGNASNPGTYRIDNLPLVLNNPEKEGYDFTGWTDQDGNTSTTVIIANVAKDLEYTANFSLKNYNLTYSDVTDEEKALMNNPITYTINDSITLTNPANRNDSDGDLSLKFVGWKDETGSVSKTVTISNSKDDKEYTATWVHVKPDTYTIEYHLDDGSIQGGTNPNEYTKITETFTLINPKKEGWKFTGWTGTNLTTPSKTVTIEQGSKGDLEYFAHYEEFSYDIVYDLDDGEITEGTNPEHYKVTDTFTLINPTKRGYRFIGWTGTGLSDLTLDVTIPLNSTGDRSYKANYELVEYRIDYTMNGGTIPEGSNPTKYKVTETFTLLEPVLEGHIFDGWTGSNGDTPEHNVQISNEVGDKEYVANFSPNSYTIIFDKNNTVSTETMDPEPMSYDTPKNLTKNKYTYKKHKFVGWTLNKEGTGTIYGDEAEVVNLALEGTVTLYAQWEDAYEALFDTGTNVRSKLIKLAGNVSNIHKIKYYDGVIDTAYQTDNNKISITNKSDRQIYAWYESSTNTIYYGSEADTLYLNPNCTSMFEGMTKVTEIDTHFDTSQVTNMTKMFFKCQSLVTMDISNFNTKLVTNMTSMFSECNSYNSFDFTNWDVKNVTNFNFMFNQCYGPTILDLTSFVTEAAKSYNHMFSSMTNVETILIPNFDSKNVTDMISMFDDNNSLKNINITHLVTNKVTSFKQFMKNTWALESVDLTHLDTSSAKDMTKMFYTASALKELDISNFNTSKVTNFDNMFSGMTNIEKIYVGAGFITTTSTSNSIMFEGDTNIVGQNGTVYDPANVRKSYAHVDGVGGAGYFWSK